jgi:hypothetical protein
MTDVTLYIVDKHSILYSHLDIKLLPKYDTQHRKYKIGLLMRFEVLRALLMKISVSPEITHCRLVCSIEVSDEISESVFGVVKRWSGV